MARVGGDERRKPNTLFHGDNLDILRQYVDDASVDLVYLDPPFQSGRDHNLLFTRVDGTRSPAQIKAFTDTWTWDYVAKEAFDEMVRSGSRVGLVLESIERVISQTPMLAYMAMMAPRLIELHRVLKPTGALYLHCDPVASHYLKMVLDAVFGPGCFRSEVIWKRSSAHSGAKKFAPVHDTIFFYTKSDSYTWNPIHQPLPKETADAWYNNIEEGTGRRFNRDNLTAAGVRKGSSGLPWRGVNPSAKGRHWAIPGFLKEIVGEKDTLDALDALDAAGRIFWPKKKNGSPMLKRYLDEAKGPPALDVITHISPLNNVDAERLGYPTQKPVALLEHLLRAASNEGDVVLDPFCGCGTTIEAAQKLRRRWIGIDITEQAIRVIRKDRIADRLGDIAGASYTMVREPPDMDGAIALASEDRHQFERWAVRLVGGDYGNKKKGADSGIDGVITFQESLGGPVQKVIISIKSGGVSVRDVRDLRGTIEREKAAIGVLVTLNKPTGPMRKEAASVGSYMTRHSSTPGVYPRLQLLTVEELLDGASIKAPETFRRKGPKRASRQTEFTFVSAKSK